MGFDTVAEILEESEPVTDELEESTDETTEEWNVYLEMFAEFEETLS